MRPVRKAPSAMLSGVGLVGALIAREVDGKVDLNDGHLRADVAAPKVPVLVVNLTDAEATKVLAKFDPLGGMALIDDGADHAGVLPARAAGRGGRHAAGIRD
jgi:hypothetical protein